MNKSRKILALAVVFVLAVSAVFGGGKQSGPAPKGISIALLNASNANSWRAQMEDEMNILIAQYKTEGKIANYIAYSANDDATVQLQQLNQIVNAGEIDAVIINPVSATSLNPAIDRAIQAGIIVLGVDSVISHPKVITFATDQYKWAAIQAEFLAQKLGGSGNIIVYNAIAGFPASDTREKAFDDTIAKFPNIKVLKKVYHGWDEGEAKQLTASMISTYPKIDGILNQDCSPGIMQGFLDAGVDVPKVLTSDGSITYLNMWNDYNTSKPAKAFNGIIVGNPPGIGCSAIKVAIELKNGRQFKDALLVDQDGGKAILLEPSPIINNDNLKEWVTKSKTMKDSYTFSATMSDQEIGALFK